MNTERPWVYCIVYNVNVYPNLFAEGVGSTVEKIRYYSGFIREMRNFWEKDFFFDFSECRRLCWWRVIVTSKQEVIS